MRRGEGFLTLWDSKESSRWWLHDSIDELDETDTLRIDEQGVGVDGRDSVSEAEMSSGAGSKSILEGIGREAAAAS